MTRPAWSTAGDRDRAAALDRPLEELIARRGGDELSIADLAERLREFVDAYPEFEIPVDRLATWLARLPDDD
ncbi:MAG: hypothetical protein IRY85_08865 [Micromonosporaceae bacterium]|nr:hypothetical protein [Micromonosporaceae bacterium]